MNRSQWSLLFLVILCKSKWEHTWSETTLNYWMMVEGYPNIKEEVGCLIPGCEVSSLLDINLSGGQLPHVLWLWPIDLQSQKNKTKQSGSTLNL